MYGAAGGDVVGMSTPTGGERRSTFHDAGPKVSGLKFTLLVLLGVEGGAYYSLGGSERACMDRDDTPGSASPGRGVRLLVLGLGADLFATPDLAEPDN
ncbi:hypothetical protein EYF80_027651 [Liparis tanakae]|uniref:Uncharacterized protein n=1 Tax=Liparis tanakae TaxID=230148 RepID=A0A4Z2H982_9TELE|nr:hypothetical protein EYF80_027651 [Liparis tanakae]